MEKVATYVRARFHNNAFIAIQSQNDQIDAYCKAHGYEIADSALAMGNNTRALPVLHNLLQSATEKGITKVVMVTANRICGSVEEIEELNATLDASGMTIETLDDTHETWPGSGSLVEFFLSQSRLEEDGEDPRLAVVSHYPKKRRKEK